MNFDPKTSAWLRLICGALATGIGLAIAAIQGGCKLGIAIAIGVGGAFSAIAHGLSTSPGNAQMVADAQQSPMEKYQAAMDALNPQKPVPFDPAMLASKEAFQKATGYTDPTKTTVIPVPKQTPPTE